MHMFNIYLYLRQQHTFLNPNIKKYWNEREIPTVKQRLKAIYSLEEEENAESVVFEPSSKPSTLIVEWA